MNKRRFYQHISIDDFRLVDLPEISEARMRRRTTYLRGGSFFKLDSTSALPKAQGFTENDWELFILRSFKKKICLKKEDKRDPSLLKSVMRSGIKTHLRAHAYMIISGAFCNLNEADDQEFALLFEKKNEQEHNKIFEQIEFDIKRTWFPQHFEKVELEERDQSTLTSEETQRISILREEKEYLESQTRDVLQLYAIYDPDIGYIQGLNSIVASLCFNFLEAKKLQEKLSDDLIQQFKLEYNTKEIFYIFRRMMSDYNIKGSIKGCMEGLQTNCLKFSELLEVELPEIHTKMLENGVLLKIIIRFQ